MQKRFSFLQREKGKGGREKKRKRTPDRVGKGQQHERYVTCSGSGRATGMTHVQTHSKPRQRAFGFDNETRGESRKERKELQKKSCRRNRAKLKDMESRQVMIHGGRGPARSAWCRPLRRNHSSMHFFPFALRKAKLAFVASSKTWRTFSWRGVERGKGGGGTIEERRVVVLLVGRSSAA